MGSDILYLLMVLICSLVYFVVKGERLKDRDLEAGERGDRKRRLGDPGSG
jgi:hypothetical protein